MAHANPEFALGLMRPTVGPVSAQVRDLPNIRDLRARMARIEADVRDGITLAPADQAAWNAWCVGRRQIRAQQRMEAATPTAFAEPVGGMHASGKAGERFVEPKRRYPADVQRGRPDKPVRHRRPT